MDLPLASGGLNKDEFKAADTLLSMVSSPIPVLHTPPPSAARTHRVPSRISISTDITEADQVVASNNTEQGKLVMWNMPPTYAFFSS